MLRFISFLLLFVLGCTKSSQDSGVVAAAGDTRSYLMGVGPIWKNYSAPTQDNMLDMYGKVSSFGELLIVQGTWRDSPAADGSTIPAGISPYLILAGNFGYTPQVGINFYKESLGVITVYLNREAPFSPVNNWSNTDAQAAYTTLVFTILNSHHPKYLALGIEVNTYWEHDPVDFDRFVAYYKTLYSAIKSSGNYNDTKIFVTFQLEKLKKKGFSGSENWTPFEKFAGYLDIAAFTTYPELLQADPALIPSNYYSELPTKGNFSIPMAFAEVGWGAVGAGQEAVQTSFIDKFFQMTDGSNIRFINWAFMHDLDTNGPLTTIGLYTSDGTPKAGLSHWTNKAKLRVK